MNTWCRYIVIWHSLTFSEHSHGCTLGALGALWAHFGHTPGELWVHSGCTLDDEPWAHFGCTLGTLWVHFGCTLHALWVRSDILYRKITGTDAYLVQVYSYLALTHIWCTFTLGTLGTHSGCTLDALWMHFWAHFGCTFGHNLGALWTHSGQTLTFHAHSHWVHLGTHWAHSDISCRKIMGANTH
jgi:hypothetical protein